MNLQRTILSISSVGIFTQYEITKAKTLFRKEFNECAICGCRKHLEVHHIKPVHVYPELACERSNFITLCDAKNNGCHRWFGHFGNFRRKFNINIRQYAYANRIYLQHEEHNREFLVSTEKLLEHFCSAPNILKKEFISHTTNLNNLIASSSFFNHQIAHQ